MHQHTASSSEPRTVAGLRTVDGVAEYLATSRWNIYRLVSRGELRAVRVGERLRFREEDIAAYLARDMEPGP
jgi:excisionase family DNA binding protein